MKPIRRLLAGLLTLLLALGLTSAPTAQAASTASGSGTGSASSNSFYLEAGLYRTHFQYSGCSDGSSWDSWSCGLDVQLRDAEDELVTSIATGDAVTGDQHDVVALKADWYSVRVSVFEDGTTWTFAVERIARPTTPASTFAGDGVGTGSGDPVRLVPGTYRAEVSYADNTYSDGNTAYIAVSLYGADPDVYFPLVADGPAAGTVTRVFRVTKADVYWVHMIGESKTTWNYRISLLPKALTKTKAPSISGTAKVGKKLKAKHGTWKPSGISFSYQWYRNSTAIAGATKSTYKLIAADKGAKIRVTVTGSKSGYTAMTRSSKLTRKVR